MRKLLTLTSVAAVSMSTLSVGGITTFANEHEVDTERIIEHEVGTESIISFIANEDGGTEVVLPPVDGDGNDIPDVEIPVIDPDNKGALEIAYAPTLNFGVQAISVRDEYYPMIAEMHNLKGQSVEVPVISFAQVQDTRGSGEGWTLSVTQSEFIATGTLDRILRGAQITFFDSGLHYEGDPANRPSVTEEIPLVAGQAFDIMTANDGKGAGVSSITWGNQADLDRQFADPDTDEVLNPAIQLFVPGSSTPEATTYEATLTWELTLGVANQ